MKNIHYLLPAVLSVFFSACIREDDGIPGDLNLPVISTTAEITVQEDDADKIVQLTFQLTGENTTNAIVSFAAVPGTAVVGDDYQLVNTGKLLFAPGETTATIDIKIVADEVKEPREQLQIKLYNPLNTRVESELITINIEDDDNNAAGLAIPTSGYTTPTSYPGYSLVWSDEFDGAELNTANWTYEMGDGCPGNCGWGNNELEYYRTENTTLVEGNLVITAKKQSFGGKEYTSSRLITKGKQQFKFGRIDIRAALPKGKGVWPALWMLGSNIDAVGWPACGEIDIMELTGDLPNRVLSTVHFGQNLGSHQYKSQSKYLSGGDDFNKEFHVFSMNWKADIIEFMIDDEVYHTITPASLNGAPYPFNKNFFFIFNVAVGGNLPGNPDNSTAFPQWMIVDYVRVFQ